MDPQKLSQLDPKLREAYQRVMGTAILQSQTVSAFAEAPADKPAQMPQVPTPTGPAPTPIVPTPVPTPEPQPEPIPAPNIEPEPFFKPQPPVSEPAPEPQPPINPQPQSTPTPQETSNFVQMNSEVPTAPAPVPAPNFTTPAPQTQAIALKKKSGMMMPILFGIVGLVFIVIYTLFWTKIFNFKLPFLP